MLIQNSWKEYILLSLNLISDTVANCGGRPKTKSWITLKKIQSKGLRIINFKGPWESSASLYKELKIFNLKDIILLNNIQFVYDQINKNVPESFYTFFTLKTEQHRQLMVPTQSQAVRSETGTSYKINLALNLNYLT